MCRLIALTSLLYLLTLLSPLYSQSPDYGNDSIRCLASLSVMSEFAKMELYDEAYDAWKYCFDQCPSASLNIYIIGSSILRNRIENAVEPAAKEGAIDTLLLLYDRRIAYYGQEGYVLGRKALDLLAYRPSETESVYALLKTSVSIEKAGAETAVLGTFLQVSSVMYRKRAIPADTIIENYATVLDCLTAGTALSPSQVDRIAESLNDILIRSGAATCTTLQDDLLPKLDEHISNVNYLKSIVSLMGRLDCVASDLNLRATGLLFEAVPSPDMAIYLANAFLTAGEPAKANEFYGTALKMEDNASVKAGIYCQMSLVSQQMGEYETARDLARQALVLQPGMGEAYLAIGLAYVASAEKCGENSFERQAVYWAATDKFARAAAIDPSARDKAEELIRQYSPYFPDNDTAFFNGYNDGDVYHVGCWINEDTLVRTRKTGQ